MATPIVVISRTAPTDAARREFEDLLAERLAAEGLSVTLLPDIYRMRPDAAALAALGQSGAPVLLFSWLRPRAAFWVLAALGVKGRRAETPAGAGERAIVPLNLSDRCCPGRWVERVAELLGGAFPGGQGTVHRLDAATDERWYPVIDYTRCCNCLDCLEFCLFGVYDTDADGRIVAATPDACKPGCPACSRVCPSQAIVFPLYHGDAAIAGADEGRIEPFDSAQIAKTRERYAQGNATVEDVVRACACERKAGEADEEAESRPPAEKKDKEYFDHLIEDVMKDGPH